MYNDFIRWCAPTRDDTILDVGVSDMITKASNALERKYPFTAKITATGLGAGKDFQAAFPAVAYYQIETGERLPFPDGQFAISTANAVLEHVGSLQKQINFISELLRVARKVFITVPNRFFPIEHHTAIPLMHWTDFGFQLACKLFDKTEWCRQERLILLSKNRVRRLVPSHRKGIAGYTGLMIGHFSSNLFMFLPEQ